MLEPWQAVLIVGANLAAWVFVVTCVVRICRKAGFSRWGALWLFFWPVGLGLLAFKEWPALKGQVR